MTAKNKILIKAVLLLFVIISVVNIVVTQVKYSRDKATLDSAKSEEAAHFEPRNSRTDEAEHRRKASS